MRARHDWPLLLLLRIVWAGLLLCCRRRQPKWLSSPSAARGAAASGGQTTRARETKTKQGRREEVVTELSSGSIERRTNDSMKSVVAIRACATSKSAENFDVVWKEVHPRGVRSRAVAPGQGAKGRIHRSRSPSSTPSSSLAVPWVAYKLRLPSRMLCSPSSPPTATAFGPEGWLELIVPLCLLSLSALALRPAKPTRSPTSPSHHVWSRTTKRT